MQKSITLVADIGLDDQLVQTMLSLLQVLYDAVPLHRVEFTQSPHENTEFEYKIEAVDGRTWTQTITFGGWPDPDVDPPMTFDVPEGWRAIAEFQYHRDLRTHLIAMVNNAGMTKLELEWE